MLDTTKCWTCSTNKYVAPLGRPRRDDAGHERGELILPVEVELTFEGKEPERRLWDDGRRWARWEYERPEKLLEVRLDPDGKLALDADRLNNERRLEPDPAAARKLATSFLFWVQQGMALLGM